MSVGTATVETLTAEVRVLMVGSRQVTLSVVKQLDAVAWDQMEPFGRVRCTNPNVTSPVMLIGRHRVDGVLVVAAMPQTSYRVNVGVLPEPITVCHAIFHDPSLIFEGRRIWVEAESIKECGIHGHLRYADLASDLRCKGWDSNGNEEVIRERIAGYDSYAARVKVLEDMPLIVLAGLK